MLEILSKSHEKSINNGKIKTENTLKITAIICAIIMLVAQIILLFTFKGEQISDSKTYLRLAKEVAEKGRLYPGTDNLKDVYIFGNGFVNLLGLVIKLTNGIEGMFILNIVFSWTILFCILYILKKNFNEKSVLYIFTILFCLLNTFWSEVVLLRTEMPFTAVAFLGMAVLYSNKKYAPFLSGILFALANWIRPLGLPLILGAIFVLIYQNKKIKDIIKVLVSFVLVIVIIGSLTYLNCGKFIYQSETLGVNLLMSANDNADGSYMDIMQEGEAGYIEPEERQSMIYSDYNSHFMKLSINWIKKHPIKYLSQIPKKMFYLYITETYSGTSYFDNKLATGGIDYIYSVAKKIKGTSNEKLTFGDILIITDQLWYMFIAVMFFVGIFVAIKNNRWRFMLPFWVFMLIGTGINMIVVGGARYHFVYLPIMILGGAIGINNIICTNQITGTED